MLSWKKIEAAFPLARATSIFGSFFKKNAKKE
jgi:hypothetical protein